MGKTALTGSEEPAAAADGNGQTGDVAPGDPDPQQTPAGADADAGDPGADAGDQGDSTGGEAGSESKDQEPAEQGPPEKYEFQLPDGQKLDPKLLEIAEPVFRELNLTQDQAQKLIDLQAARVRQEAESWEATTEAWLEQARADPDIGGAKWKSTLAQSAGVIKKLGTPALVQWLDETGIGNHPELVRIFARVSRAIGEDSTGSSAPRTTDSGDSEEATLRKLYPTMFDKK